MDTCICMGASIGNATGLSKVLDEEERKKVVAVIGDSTFLHTGIKTLKATLREDDLDAGLGALLAQAGGPVQQLGARGGRSGGLRGVPRGTVKSLRVIGYEFTLHGFGGEPYRVGFDGPWDV